MLIIGVCANIKTRPSRKTDKECEARMTNRPFQRMRTQLSLAKNEAMKKLKPIWAKEDHNHQPGESIPVKSREDSTKTMNKIS